MRTSSQKLNKLNKSVQIKVKTEIIYKALDLSIIVHKGDYLLCHNYITLMYLLICFRVSFVPWTFMSGKRGQDIPNNSYYKEEFEQQHISASFDYDAKVARSFDNL